MKQTIWTFSGVVLLLIISIYLASNGRSESTVMGVEDKRLLRVESKKIELADRYIRIQKFTGLIEPSRKSTMGFEVLGSVEKVQVEEGDRVQKNQELAKLDTDQIEAQLLEAQADLKIAEGELKRAENKYKRIQFLKESGSSSVQDLEDASQVKLKARGRKEMLEARIRVISEDIRKSTIFAPFDGVVIERHVDEGTLAGIGTVALTLMATDRLEARIGIPRQSAQDLEVGQLYPLMTQKGEEIEARLRAILPVIDKMTQTQEIWFDIDDPESVVAGQVIHIQLSRSENQRGVWLPRTSLEAGIRGLWTVYSTQSTDEKDPLTGDPVVVLEKRPIRIIHSHAEEVFVSGAIETGMSIITTGIQKLSPGQHVVTDQL